MSNLTVKFALSDEYRKQQFALTGDMPASPQVIRIDMESATHEQREVIAAFADVDLTIAVERYYIAHKVNQFHSTKMVPLDGVPDLQTAVEHCRRMAAERAECQRALNEYRADSLRANIVEYMETYRRSIEERAPSPRGTHGISDNQREMAAQFGIDLTEHDHLREEYQAMQPVFKAEAAERDVAEREAERVKKEKADAERDAQRRERLWWARQHGSKHLVRALEAGHPAVRQYWIERAGVEYPGYVLDYENAGEWKDRSYPSEAALDERDAMLTAHAGVEVKIAWLTSEPRDSRSDGEFDEPFEACEAVVIDDPAYKHYLVKVL